jgi:tetratricopeptide (TPR) repeat protein
MLAAMIGVPVAVIRRWHRRGAIKAARVVRRLPYFDFQDVAAARRLAQLLDAGCSPAAIDKKLAELARLVPSLAQPLAELPVIVEGRQLLVRDAAGGLREPGGQFHFDFDMLDREPITQGTCFEGRAARDGSAAPTEPLPTPQDLFGLGLQLEEHGDLRGAADVYRSLLALAGPNAEVNFLLADVLYRLGEPAAARERYYAAIELDEDFVEARANLGCVLAELGQSELAVAAFQGALALHPEYADAHYHLARTLDQLGSRDEAAPHWRVFLELMPESPWADEAQHRLARPQESN